MGITNFQYALQKKFAVLSGEREALLEQIDRIKRDQARLPEMEARAAELGPLIQSAAMLLREENADWDEAEAPPIRPWTHTLPVRFGTCGRKAMEVLRKADRPMTVREITLEVLHSEGVYEPDRETIQRTQNAVDSSLRNHRGQGVESSGKYPAQWRSMAKPDIEFDG